MDIQEILYDEPDIDPLILKSLIEERINPTRIVFEQLYPSDLIQEEDYIEFVIDEYDYH